MLGCDGVEFEDQTTSICPRLDFSGFKHPSRRASLIGCLIMDAMMDYGCVFCALGFI